MSILGPRACGCSLRPLCPQGSPALVDGADAASAELGGGGTGGKGPMGGQSGNMPGGKGGSRPWGTVERGQGRRKSLLDRGRVFCSEGGTQPQPMTRQCTVRLHGGTTLTVRGLGQEGRRMGGRRLPLICRLGGCWGLGWQ